MMHPNSHDSTCQQRPSTTNHGSTRTNEAAMVRAAAGDRSIRLPSPEDTFLERRY